MAGDVRVYLRKAEIKALALSDDMAAVVVAAAEQVVPKAKALAPVSPHGSHGRRPGFLRANIRTRYGKDTESVFANVTTNARTPAGFPYGRFIEVRKQSYLKAALGE